MDKIKAKLASLSQDRRYMFFVGIAIVFNGLIGLAVPALAAFLGIILGPFCLLVGYYGGDVKKGLEEFKHDVMEAKGAAEAAAKKSADAAKAAAEKAKEGAEKATAVAKDAADKAEAGAKKAASTAKDAADKAGEGAKKAASTAKKAAKK